METIGRAYFCFIKEPPPNYVESPLCLEIRPAELSLQRRSRLNGHSHPVKHFDIFFSHTWLTPGRWKVLSLLLQRGCTFMLLAWSFGIALSFVLCMFDILPLSASWQSLAIGFRADTPVGYWLMVFGAIFALGGFLSAPTFAPGWSETW